MQEAVGKGRFGSTATAEGYAIQMAAPPKWNPGQCGGRWPQTQVFSLFREGLGRQDVLALARQA